MTLIESMGSDWPWITLRVASWTIIAVLYVKFALDNIWVMRRIRTKAAYATNGLLAAVFLIGAVHRIWGLLGVWWPLQRFDAISGGMFAIVCIVWAVMRRGKFPHFVTAEALREKEIVIRSQKDELYETELKMRRLEKRLEDAFSIRDTTS